MEKPEFDWLQKEQVSLGLKNGVNVSIYAIPEFDWLQMQEIREGLESGVDVSIYAIPEFDWLQMREIREGLEKEAQKNKNKTLNSMNIF